VGWDRRQAIAVRPAFDEAGERRKLAGIEHRSQHLPVDTVPADDEYALWHVGNLAGWFGGL
jgi:hypothetical protein